MVLHRRLLAILLVLALPASALSQDRPLEVRVLGGRCGAPIARTEEPRPADLTARSPAAGVVMITLTRFPFYCSPAPRFDAMLRDDGTIELRAREPEPPVARCTCDHTVRLRLGSVPSGTHPIEVRFRDELIARGRVDVSSAPAR